jgi:hypothetical protein
MIKGGARAPPFLFACPSGWRIGVIRHAIAPVSCRA